MLPKPQLAELEPVAVLEAGDLDCGSGLVLLLRDAMADLSAGSVLEMRSRESTVRDELPPWCGMVGHDYLGELPGDGHTRYFICRGGGAAAQAEMEALENDKEQARSFEWRTRIRHSGHLKATVYCRNFKFDVGQAASFEEQDSNPSAVEYVFGALGGSLAVAFATECAQRGLEIDDVELTVRGTLHNVLAHLGIEDGDPAIAAIEVRCYVSTFADDDAVRQAWSSITSRSPVLTTLGKCVEIDNKLSIV